MKQPGPVQRGYSLIEMLVVLAIVAILSIAGITYLGNRPATGVRTVLDEIEGALLEAHKQAVSTGRDVTLATVGSWDAATPLVLVRGDATILPADWIAAVTAAQNNTWPPAQGTMSNAQYSSLALAFRVGTAGTALTREHVNAGVAVADGWWVLAEGSTNPLTSIAPFNAVAGFINQIDSSSNRDARRLFDNAPLVTPNTAFSISGTNKRFNQTLWIPVVSIINGGAVPDGPRGAIFVQGNGATIYKFYNPGAKTGDGKWRRI